MGMANLLLFVALINMAAAWSDYRIYQDRLRYYYISDWVEKECGRRAVALVWLAFVIVLIAQFLRGAS